MIENITQLNGIDMISSGLGIQKVVVRGLSGMRVVTYLNGMQINNQQWANDHGIGFTDLGLGEVELIKGASALKYGSEAIGGLLFFKDEHFTLADKPKIFLATKLNSSSFLSNNQFGMKMNKKNLFLNIYGQYAISSDYRLPNNDFLFNSRFKQHAIKLSLSYRKKNMNHIFRYQLHNETPGIPAHTHDDPSSIDLTEITSSSLDFENDFKTTRPNQFVQNQLFIYENDFFLNKFNFSLYLGHFKNNLKEYEKWTLPAFDIKLSNTLITPSVRYINKNLKLNFGSQISFSENYNNMIERLIPNATSLNIGPYAILDFEKNNFGLNSGIRYDYKSLKSIDEIFNTNFDEVFSTTSLSSGIYYNHKEHILRFCYSEAFRSPHFSELFSNGVHHGTNRHEIGDQQLDIEKANQIDFKYQWSNNHIGLIINPFTQYITNFISINPLDSIINGYRVYKYTQYDKVEIKGLEINLHYHPKQIKNIHLEQSYSFLKTKNKDDSYGLALIPANSIKTHAHIDLSEYEKLIKYKLNRFTIYHLYKFKQNSFVEFEESTDSYSVINLSIGLNFSNSFKGSFLVNNLLNKEYSPHTSRIRSVAGGVPNPGRFYSINLKYKF